MDCFLRWERQDQYVVANISLLSLHLSFLQQFRHVYVRIWTCRLIIWIKTAHSNIGWRFSPATRSLAHYLTLTIALVRFPFHHPRLRAETSTKNRYPVLILHVNGLLGNYLYQRSMKTLIQRIAESSISNHQSISGLNSWKKACRLNIDIVLSCAFHDISIFTES